MDNDEFYEIMDDREEIIIPRLRKRYVRNYENPIEFYEEDEFRMRYRFSKESVLHILYPLIERALQTNNKRGLPIPPMLQLLTGLRFYATGSFQLVSADLRGISQPTVSRIMRKISVHFAEMLGQYIKFPETNEQQRQNIILFSNMSGFPSVAGCVDGTHIPIASPGGNNAEVFRNRKGYLSLNVQVVVGPRKEILDIVVRHPGSTHDSVVFDRSSVRVRFELQQIQGLLLGDNGYPSRPYLLTPVLNPVTNAEIRYNRAHRATRNLVERVFGMWKKIFPCIHFPLRCKIETSLAIICATAVLYNINIQNRVIAEENVEVIRDEDIPFINDDRNVAGLAYRRAFIITHF